MNRNHNLPSFNEDDFEFKENKTENKKTVDTDEQARRAHRQLMIGKAIIAVVAVGISFLLLYFLMEIFSFNAYALTFQ